MKQEVVLSHWKDYLPEDGMLFVRTPGILTTMVRAPLIVVGLFVVAITVPAQNSFASFRSLELTIYPDGTTHVFSEISVNPLEPDFTIELFGNEIDNFVAQDEGGFLLSSKLEKNSATVETLGASQIVIDYDTHDLVSKQGRIWSFVIDSPIDYSLLMPKNTVIVGMSTYPINMQITNEQSQLQLPSGHAEINYFFGISNTTPIQDPQGASDNSIFFIAGGIAALGIIATFFLKRTRKTAQKQIVKPISQEKSNEPIDTSTIFELHPELREDDKELVNFLSSNGGQAYESELRKKFLQPRTTMWRAVKRLERYGIVEIEKKELQNLVKLKKKLGDEK
jgi:hypothetical protein